MNLMIQKFALYTSGYQEKVNLVQKIYGADILENTWPTNKIKIQLVVTKAWIDLLATPYMRDRLAHIRQTTPDYTPQADFYFYILTLKSPKPFEYLARIESFFMQVTNFLLPDEYIPFTIASPSFCYRHIIAYLAKNKVSLSIPALNPFLVNALCSFSSGYTTTKNDLIPNPQTLAFLSQMLQHIDQDKALLNLLDSNRNNLPKMNLLFGNIAPLSKPVKQPHWDVNTYETLVSRLTVLSQVHDSDPNILR